MRALPVCGGRRSWKIWHFLQLHDLFFFIGDFSQQFLNQFSHRTELRLSYFKGVLVSDSPKGVVPAGFEDNAVLFLVYFKSSEGNESAHTGSVN